MSATKYLVLLGAMASLVVAVSCTDPVIDDAIEALGDEPPGPGPGPLHRPGQPCVLCHQEGGSSSTHFAAAGTIYDKKYAEGVAAKGVEGVEVMLVDAAGQVPSQPHIFTNAAGNFYVLEQDWPVQFPFHVRLLKPGATTYQTMSSQVGRDGSCAGCHRNPKKNVSNDKYGALGQVYVD